MLFLHNSGPQLESDKLSYKSTRHKSTHGNAYMSSHFYQKWHVSTKPGTKVKCICHSFIFHLGLICMGDKQEGNSKK